MTISYTNLEKHLGHRLAVAGHNHGIAIMCLKCRMILVAREKENPAPDETRLMVCTNNADYEDCMTLGNSYPVAIQDMGNGDHMYKFVDDKGDPLQSMLDRFKEPPFELFMDKEEMIKDINKFIVDKTAEIEVVGRGTIEHSVALEELDDARYLLSKEVSPESLYTVNRGTTSVRMFTLTGKALGVGQKFEYIVGDQLRVSVANAEVCGQVRCIVRYVSKESVSLLIAKVINQRPTSSLVDGIMTIAKKDIYFLSKESIPSRPFLARRRKS